VESLDRCPCCNISRDYEPLSLFCKLRDFSFLGCAYPFYFHYSLKCLVVIVVFFVIGGSLNIFIVNMGCDESSCVLFFGMGILNYNDL